MNDEKVKLLTAVHFARLIGVPASAVIDSVTRNGPMDLIGIVHGGCTFVQASELDSHRAQILKRSVTDSVRTSPLLGPPVGSQ